jgi:hypothetical protein
MTDTAQPYPDAQTDDGSNLTPEMQQRAAALGIARSILKSTAIFGPSGVQNWSVQDLLTIGDYILGVGPFTDLKTIGALPISQADADAVWAAPKPDGGLPPGELPLGGLGQSTALDDPEPKNDVADDDPTEALPAYPEDALPR